MINIILKRNKFGNHVELTGSWLNWTEKIIL